MKHKLTDQGLKNYILDIALPEPFTLNDVLEKMRKHQHNFIYSYSYRLRPILTQMVEKGFLTEKLGSEKRAHGSVTEIFYTKVWKDDDNGTVH
jgi:hypothetical protein